MPDAKLRERAGSGITDNEKHVAVTGPLLYKEYGSRTDINSIPAMVYWEEMLDLARAIANRIWCNS